MAEPKRKTETTWVPGKGYVTTGVSSAEGANDTTETFNNSVQEHKGIDWAAIRNKKKKPMTPGEGAAALASRKKESQ